MNNDCDNALFEPELILPAQMTAGARVDGDTSGARALMLAILEDAMLCIERGRRRRHAPTRKLAAEAESWVRSDCQEWLFSFASICDVLGMDPDALRARLLTHVERPASGGRVQLAQRPTSSQAETTPLSVCRRGAKAQRLLSGLAPIDSSLRTPTRTARNRLILEPDVAARLWSRLPGAECGEPVPRRGMRGAAGRRARTSSRVRR